MSGRPARDLVLIFVEQVDRRLAPAVSLATALPDVEVRAIHISQDPAETAELARAWIGNELAWLPLRIEDVAADAPDPILTRLAEVVADESTGRARVIVLLPEVDLDRWWQPLLHRSLSRRIARQLRGMRQVSTVIVPYPVSA